MEINKQIELLNNICPLGKGYHNSKREHRLKFFEDIQTEIQAYLLGFYVADGSLNEERHTIRIKIKNTDSEILDLYSNYICPDARRVIFPETSMIGPKGKEIHISEVGQVDITGKIICDALVSYGYGPRKTYQELHLPKLSDELLWHFIRGYFDGDGCITGSISEPNKKNREINPRLKLRAEWISKTRSLLEEINVFLAKYNIKGTIITIKDTNTYRLSVSSIADIKLLFNNIYKDSNFYLKRKFNKFNYYVNTEVSRLIADHRNA